MKIEVSNGEIIDKLTIVSIKLQRIHDQKKISNLQKEFDELSAASQSILPTNDPLYHKLLEVNTELWDIEEKIRQFEKEQNFGAEFISLARSVYKKNDERFRIKTEINLQTSSTFLEEKSFDDHS